MVSAVGSLHVSVSRRRLLRDGSRASGPPPRGLYTYDYRMEGGQIWIKAGQMPTLSDMPSVATVGKTKGGTCA